MKYIPEMQNERNRYRKKNNNNNKKRNQKPKNNNTTCDCDSCCHQINKCGDWAKSSVNVAEEQRSVLKPIYTAKTYEGPGEER